MERSEIEERVADERIIPYITIIISQLMKQGNGSNVRKRNTLASSLDHFRYFFEIDHGENLTVKQLERTDKERYNSLIDSFYRANNEFGVLM